MGGALMQLVAYGAQDVYLTGNPQITFWKVTYRRHTNFALELLSRLSTARLTLVATLLARSAAMVILPTVHTFR